MIRLARAAALFALVLCSPCLTAQDTTGTIFGSVLDTTGAAVVDATVQILAPQTGLTRVATTGAAGEYRFSLVPVGVYNVSSQKAGYKTQLTEGVAVEICPRTRSISCCVLVRSQRRSILKRTARSWIPRAQRRGR